MNLYGIVVNNTIHFFNYFYNFSFFIYFSTKNPNQYNKQKLINSEIFDEIYVGINYIYYWNIVFFKNLLLFKYYWFNIDFLKQLVNNYIIFSIFPIEKNLSIDELDLNDSETDNIILDEIHDQDNDDIFFDEFENNKNYSNILKKKINKRIGYKTIKIKNNNNELNQIIEKDEDSSDKNTYLNYRTMKILFSSLKKKNNKNNYSSKLFFNKQVNNYFLWKNIFNDNDYDEEINNDFESKPMLSKKSILHYLKLQKILFSHYFFKKKLTDYRFGKKIKRLNNKFLFDLFHFLIFNSNNLPIYFGFALNLKDCHYFLNNYLFLVNGCFKYDYILKKNDIINFIIATDFLNKIYHNIFEISNNFLKIKLKNFINNDNNTNIIHFQFPNFLEIDFLTLSGSIIYDNLSKEEYFFFLKNINIFFLKMYNWKIKY